ncbi:MAG: esterase [Thermodesulfobacteriota bacterium]|nr:MAG: esterase [Thermodesulfobacteriota bacterium]
MLFNGDINYNNTMKLGLALGGGGAKGFAHLGILEVFTEAGIEFDVVAGTSIGAFIGAVYISDNLSDLKQYAVGIGIADLPFLLGPTWPKGGLFSGKFLEKLIDKFIQVENIEDLKKPFAAVCVDLNKGETITFTSGNIKRAIRASTSIPGLFKPIMFEDKLLVDGGVLESVPDKAVRDIGADFVLAIDLLSDLSGNDSFKNTKPPSIVDVVQRSSILAQRIITEYKFKEHPPDLVISPPLSHIKVMDFHNGKSIVEIGREAAKKVLPELLDKINKN